MWALCVRAESMNKDWILFHLKESLEEIESTIKDIENDPDYGHEEYSVAITHLYHHVNTAWNSQDCSTQDAEESNDENFSQWRQFPENIDMSC
jgi:hypothetical protein